MLEPARVANVLALRVLPAVAFALLLALGGCKPKEGGSCKNEGRELCVTEAQALACHDGVWVPMACKGKLGCDKASENGVCDQSAAAEGDVCNLESDFVCSADKKSRLECRKHKWTVDQTCKGDRGCMIEQGKVSCDNTVAALGDPCRDEDDHACTADKSSALVCRSGKFQTAAYCKGPKACRVTLARDRLQVSCDDSLATLGDPCEPEGHYSCAVGERSILKCKEKHFAQDEACKGREKCRVKDEQVSCN